jgi:hypothetical protein
LFFFASFIFVCHTAIYSCIPQILTKLELLPEESRLQNSARCTRGRSFRARSSRKWRPKRRRSELLSKRRKKPTSAQLVQLVEVVEVEEVEEVEEGAEEREHEDQLQERLHF